MRKIMIYISSHKDEFYEHLTGAYFIEVDGRPIYWGNNAAGSPINITRRIKSYLSSSMPDFRDMSEAIIPHPEQLRVFNLRDSGGTLLESYTYLYQDSGEWAGDWGILNGQVNGHADPRQKLFFTNITNQEVAEVSTEFACCESLELEISRSLTFTYQDTRASVGYTACTEFTASTTSSWLSVEKSIIYDASGNSTGSGFLYLTFSENPYEYDRTAEITLTYYARGFEYRTEVLTVVQQQFIPRYLTITSAPTGITYSRQDVTCRYTTDCDGKAAYELYSGQTADAYNLIRSATTNSLTELLLFIGANEEEVPAYYKVTIKASNKEYPNRYVASDTATFTQSGITYYYNVYGTIESTSQGQTTLSPDTNLTSLDGVTYSIELLEGNSGYSVSVISLTLSSLTLSYDAPPVDGEYTAYLNVYRNGKLISTSLIRVADVYVPQDNISVTVNIKVPWYETGYTIEPSFGYNVFKDTLDYDNYTGAAALLQKGSSKGTVIYSTQSATWIASETVPSYRSGPRGDGKHPPVPVLSIGEVFGTLDAVKQSDNSIRLSFTQNTSEHPRTAGIRFSGDSNYFHINLTQDNYPQQTGSTVAIVNNEETGLVNPSTTGLTSRYFEPGVFSGVAKGITVVSSSSTTTMTVYKSITSNLTVYTASATGDITPNPAFCSPYLDYFGPEVQWKTPNVGAFNKKIGYAVRYYSGTGSGWHPETGATVVFTQNAPATPGTGTTFNVRISSDFRVASPQAGENFVTYPQFMYADWANLNFFCYSGSTGSGTTSTYMEPYCTNEKIVFPFPVKMILGGNYLSPFGENGNINATHLLEVTVPDGVETIKYGFAYCYKLTTASLPASLTEITGCFFDCIALTSLTFRGTVSQWNAIIEKYNWKKGSPISLVICSDGYVNV